MIRPSQVMMSRSIVRGPSFLGPFTRPRRFSISFRPVEVHRHIVASFGQIQGESPAEPGGASRHQSGCLHMARTRDM